MMNAREMTERTEHEMLRPWAAFADESRGRERDEDQCELRTVFQRDRDRVIHCKSFRRLKHKTQVFLAPEGDHYRTRLTHTLEVSQIARTIARALRLNEDLTEAVALAHDLGHTPFGHAGERALNAVSPTGFRHYEQSRRVIELLEKDGAGLNLTYEVRDGVSCHTEGKEADNAEGRIIRWADRIAYMNHDIDDAIRAEVISEGDIPREITQVLGDTKTRRITSLIKAVVESSGEGGITMTGDALIAYHKLHDFMNETVYTDKRAKAEEKKVPHIIERLYLHYLDPDHLPDYMKQIALKEGRERAACDYVAGMTDHFAIAKYEELFIPRSWNFDS